MLKHTSSKQYIDKAEQFCDWLGTVRPAEGWVRTVRKALGMSSPQLAKRLGLGKAQVSQLERMEIEDRITLKQLRRVAAVLDCELVYAFAPRQPIQQMVRAQATQKATQAVMQAHAHMVLEAQQLNKKQLEEEIITQAEQFIRDRPRDLWE